MVVIDPTTWPVVRGSEQLSRYQVRPGVSVLLTEAQARQRGYLPAEPEKPAEEKRQPSGRNKKRAPSLNKSGSESA